MSLAKTKVFSRSPVENGIDRRIYRCIYLAAFLSACGPDMMTPAPAPIAELATCSAAIVNGVEWKDDKLGRLCLSRHADDRGTPTGMLTSAARELELGGFSTIGPAATLVLGQKVGFRGVDVTLPIARWSAPLSVPAQRARIVVLSRFGNGAVHITPVENIALQPPATPGGAALLRFHLPGHGIGENDRPDFQVAVPSRLGETVKRRFQYRAVAGVSMGGIGASMHFFRHPETYDAVGVMGADPGPDLTYSQSFIRDFFFGGFCPSDGKDPSCPPARAPLLDQGELFGTYEAMPIQRGEGIGLTLRRSLYLRANRDLVRALGNWAYHNPADPYLPPGVPSSTLSQPPAVACTNPVVLPGKIRDPGGKPFYDGRYNRDGNYDVITFCDGGEVDGQPGVFDDKKDHRDPSQILLAVDVNGNGRRDKGEPVIIQQSETFRDLGLDGRANRDEPGYDPVRNPDPAGDDYHYLKNPGGTEGNWRYDAGEPYDDFGLDGVKGAGCPIDSGMPGCFDHGEANGRFDNNPGLARWLDHDPHSLAERAGGEMLSQRDIYYDAGIRDFFNAHVSTSALFGALAQQGVPLRLFGGFPALVGKSPADEASYDAATAPFGELGSAVFIRYGNPETSDALAEQTGDGRHAGSVPQVVQRAVTLFSYLLGRWPDGDRTLQPADDPRLIPKNPSFKLSTGRDVPYSIILPPGYFEPANQGLYYPVVYVGHGYGMAPEDIGKSIGSLIHGFMSDPDETRRLPKAIMVFVDGVCRPGGEVPSGPLPAAGDQCEEGTFYTEHALGDYKGDRLFDELDTHLRAKYRLHAPAEIPVPF
jgi:hypothetical protein